MSRGLGDVYKRQSYQLCDGPEDPVHGMLCGYSQYFQDIAHRLCPPSELSGSSRCEQMGRAVYGDDDVLMQGENSDGV